MPPTNTHAIHDRTRPAPDLSVYRQAVADLLAEITGRAGPGDAVTAERVMARRIAEPQFAAVLAATPNGMDDAIDRVLREVRSYQPSARSSAGDLAAHARIHLFAQIEIMWWGHSPGYRTDADVLGSADLVDLEALRRSGQLRFRYRRQAQAFLARAVRAAERRVWPDRIPRTAGLRFARARPEAVTLLNQLSTEFARAAPPGTPPLWVTSLARSVEHQNRLRALGYAASLPSSHCIGYAVDVEMTWFRQFGADRGLKALLLGCQRTGDINVIDEGQAWHVCIGPAAAARLRDRRHARPGG
jgi:hypothetical protein